MGLVFITGDKKKKGKGFIPYEGHIPEHAALLPQDTRGKVGGSKRVNKKKSNRNGKTGLWCVCVCGHKPMTQDQPQLYFSDSR